MADILDGSFSGSITVPTPTVEDEEELRLQADEAAVASPVPDGSFTGSLAQPVGSDDLTRNAVRAGEVDPATIASDQQLADELGIPLEVISDGTRGELEKQALQRRIENKTKNAPTTRRLLSVASPVPDGSFTGSLGPLLPLVGSDDVDNLVSIEKAAAELGFFGHLVGPGVDQLQGLFFRFVDYTGELTGIEELEDIAAPRAIQNFAAVREATAGAPRIVDVDTLEDFRRWLQGMGKDVPTLAPGLAGTLAGAAVGTAIAPGIGTVIGGIVGAFIPSFVLGIGETQQAVKERGGEEAEAIGFVAGGGALIAALDSVLPGKVGSMLVKAVGGKPVFEGAEKVIKLTAAKVAQRAAVEGSKGILIESITEAAQEAISETAAALGTDTEIDTVDLAVQMIEAFAVGAFLGGGVTTTMSVTSDVIKARRVKKAMDAVDRLASESKLSERAPDLLAEVVRANLEAAGIDKIFVSADAVMQYANQHPDGVYAALNQLGVTENLPNAIQTGADVEIDASAFSRTVIGSDGYALLAAHVKVVEGEKSLEEAAEAVISDAEIVIDMIAELEAYDASQTLRDRAGATINKMKPGAIADVIGQAPADVHAVLMDLIQRVEARRGDVSETVKAGRVRQLDAEIGERDREIAILEEQLEERLAENEGLPPSKQLGTKHLQRSLDKLIAERDDRIAQQAELQAPARRGAIDPESSEFLTLEKRWTQEGAADPTETAPAQEFVDEAKKISGVGTESRDFFSDVTKGDDGLGDTGKTYEPVLDLGPAQPFFDEYDKHRGHFELHIATSIPGYREVQPRVGYAVTVVYGGVEPAAPELTADEIEARAEEGPVPSTAELLAAESELRSAPEIQQEIDALTPFLEDLKLDLAGELPEEVGSFFETEEELRTAIGEFEADLAELQEELAATQEGVESITRLRDQRDFARFRETFMEKVDDRVKEMMRRAGEHEWTVEVGDRVQTEFGIRRGDPPWTVIGRRIADEGLSPESDLSADPPVRVKGTDIPMLIVSRGRTDVDRERIELPEWAIETIFARDGEGLGVIEGGGERTEGRADLSVVSGDTKPRFLDIGGSEGALAKAIAATSDIEAVIVDPNPDMHATFQETSTVPGVTYHVEAFGTKAEEGQVAFEDEGTEFKFWTAEGKYEIIHESMTFQFISNDREQQVARVADLLTDDGMAIFQQKFISNEHDLAQWQANEAQKDDFKAQYFSRGEIGKKAEQVLVGMHKRMVTPQSMEETLLKHFEHVVQYWDSGNFKGYAASNDRVKLAIFVEALGSTASEFEHVATPREVTGEPAVSRDPDVDPIQFFSDRALSDARSDISGNSRRAVVMMSPAEFLALASEGRSDEKAAAAEAVLDSNGQFDSIPLLSFDLQEDGTGQVMSHEGRHRMRALQARGVARVPVVIVSRDGGAGGAIRFSTDARRPTMLIGENDPRIQVAFPAIEPASMLQRPKTPATEQQGLRQKTVQVKAKVLQDLNVTTTNEAVRATRAAFKEGLKVGETLAKQKTDIRQRIRELPLSPGQISQLNERVDRAKTGKRLEQVVAAIQSTAAVMVENNRRTQLKTAIKKILKKTKAKKTGTIKSTADVQKVLDDAREIMGLSQAHAAERLELARQEEIPDPSKYMERQLLALVADDPLLRTVDAENLLLDLATIKQIGKSAALDRLKGLRKAVAEQVEQGIENVTQGGPRAAALSTTGFFKRAAAQKRDLASSLASTWNAWDDVLDIMFNKKGVDGQPLVELLRTTRHLQRVKGKLLIWEQEVVDIGIETFGLDGYFQWLDKMHLDEQHIPHGTFINARGEEVVMEYSVAEIRKLWMERQDPTIREVATDERGNALTEEMMTVLWAHLGDADYKFARKQFALYRKIYPSVNAVYRRMRGFDLPFNEFYSPIQRSKGDKPGGDADDSFGADTIIADEQTRRRAIPRQVLDRTESLDALLPRSDVSALRRYIHDMAHFIETAEHVVHLKNVFASEPLRKEIEAHHGQAMLKFIDGFLEDLGSGYAARGRAYEKYLIGFNKRYAVSALALKPTIMAKQTASWFAMADGIPIGQFLKYQAQVFKNPKKVIRKLWKLSPAIRARGSSIDFDMARVGSVNTSAVSLKSPGWFPGMGHRMERLFFWPIRMGDRFPIYFGGWAVYQHTLKITGSEQQAIEAVNDAMNTTQQSTDLDKMSELQRSGALGRTFTMFMTSRLSLMRAELRAIRQRPKGLGGRGKITYREFGKRMAVYHFAIPMFIQFIASGLRIEPDRQLVAMILGNLNAVVIFGDLAVWALTEMIGEDGDAWRAGGDLPLAEIATELTEGMMDVLESGGEVEEVLEAVGEIADAAGAVAGQPVDRVRNIVGGAADVVDGDTHKGLLRIFGLSEKVSQEAADADFIE